MLHTKSKLVLPMCDIFYAVSDMWTQPLTKPNSNHDLTWEAPMVN